MKIVYCIPQLWNCGGMERILSIKANYLAENGYDVCFVTTCQAGKESYFPLVPSIKCYDLGINYTEIFKTKSILYQKIAYQWRQRKHKQRLEKLLHQLKADIVISPFEDEASFLVDIKDGSKKIIETHTTLLKRIQLGRKGLLKWIDIYRTKEDKKKVRGFDHFVLLTEEDKELWGDIPCPASVIPNPLTFVSKEIAKLDNKEVIALGRLNVEKHFDALIDIWGEVSKEFPEWKLSIYGEGSYRTALEQQINRLNLNNYVFLKGATKEVPQCLLEASIFVLSSRFEGFGLALTESQTVGLPSVAFACPCGPSDIITDGQNGYLVALDDKETFAKRLKHLIAHPELRKEMGAMAKKASKRYEINQVMAQWQELFAKFTHQSIR